MTNVKTVFVLLPLFKSTGKPVYNGHSRLKGLKVFVRYREVSAKTRLLLLCTSKPI